MSRGSVVGKSSGCSRTVASEKRFDKRLSCFLLKFLRSISAILGLGHKIFRYKKSGVRRKVSISILVVKNN